MQKVITRISWTRWGVNAFTEEVNSLLEEGWALSAFDVQKKGLRFVCYAILATLPLEPEVEADE